MPGNIPPKRPGWPRYTAKDLKKVNALREALSLVQITNVPILDKASILFVTAASRHNEPNSCYNCHMYNSAAETCSIIGPGVRIKKFTYPPRETKDSKPIEYWPVCGMQDYGQPNKGPAMYAAHNDPEELGLSWINAPEVGLEHGGTNCGGINGGDDCDYYVTRGDDKRAEPSGFCRVLQNSVDNGDCCAAWTDDDLIPWNRAQELLKQLDEERGKASVPNPLLGR